MFGSAYEFKREPGYRQTLRSVGRWLSSTNVGWKWLAVVLPVQAVSAWTNVIGLSLALDWPAAVVLGIGLQCIALYIGIGLLNAKDEDRARWRVPLVAILCVSVFFSFAGFTSYYNDKLEAKTKPMKARDDLRSQALILSEKANEARILAKAKLENRIQYASSLASRIRSNQARGVYPDANAAEAMIAEQRSNASAAREAEQEWDGFSFDAAAALATPSIPEGFSQLQAAYGQLSKLMGLLTKQEAEGFRMSAAPLPSTREADEAPKKELVAYAFSQLFSITGIFWLGLAIMLEGIPFWVAHARPRDVSGEEEEPLTAGHPHAVAAYGAADKALAREVSDFNAKLRPAHFIGAANMQEVEEQATKVDAVVAEMRMAHVEALRLHSLQKMADVRTAQLNLKVTEAQRRGAPESLIKKIVEDDLVEFLKDVGIEDIRLEKLREERRNVAMEPTSPANAM